ncbi:unnamed protein product [Eretmochelys imbricata]
MQVDRGAGWIVGQGRQVATRSGWWGRAHRRAGRIVGQGGQVAMRSGWWGRAARWQCGQIIGRGGSWGRTGMWECGADCGAGPIAGRGRLLSTLGSGTLQETPGDGPSSSQPRAGWQVMDRGRCPCPALCEPGFAQGHEQEETLVHPEHGQPVEPPATGHCAGGAARNGGQVQR